MALLQPKYSCKAIAYLVGGKQKLFAFWVSANYIFPWKTFAINLVLQLNSAAEKCLLTNPGVIN